jgi:hypothetical protein
MRIVAPLAASILLLLLPSLAYKEGPLPNMTGGFGDASCHSCHFDNPINAAGGALMLSGVPAAYQASRRYAVTVQLTKTGLKRGGFEISARFAQGSRRGRQAGAWRTLDARVQLQSSKDGRVQFAQHTTSGTLAQSRGTLSWTLEWSAPDAARVPVQFNVAGNASNDDASPLGDFIYVAERLAAPQR